MLTKLQPALQFVVVLSNTQNKPTECTSCQLKGCSGECYHHITCSHLFVLKAAK